jgi:hypothetical protein
VLHETIFKNKNKNKNKNPYPFDKWVSRIINMNIAAQGFAEAVKSSLKPSLATIPQRESTTPQAYEN